MQNGTLQTTMEEREMEKQMFARRQLVYQEVCTSYRAIDDFRTKLLGFLPVVTGGGIFLLFNNASQVLDTHSLPIGLFGFMVTLGLFAYEIHGIIRCHKLILLGTKLETDMGIAAQFTEHPKAVLGFINEPFAAGIIYSAVLAAWAFVALIFIQAQRALPIAMSLFIVFFAITLIYEYYLRNRLLPQLNEKRQRNA